MWRPISRTALGLEGMPNIRYTALPRYADLREVEELYPTMRETLGLDDLNLGTHWREDYGAFMREGEEDGIQGSEAQSNLHLMLEDVKKALGRKIRDDPSHLGGISIETVEEMINWTRGVIDASFGLLRGQFELGDILGCFRNRQPYVAFVIPTRVRRTGPSLFETSAHFPVTWFMGPELQAMLLSQCPPIILDVKSVSKAAGNEGYKKLAPAITLWVPITEDLVSDVGGRISRNGMKVARDILDVAAEYLRRLGIPIMALGARLPSLTNYGKTIRESVPGIITTTGHAGTCHEIGIIVTALKKRLHLPNNVPLTVIGVGSIGKAVAEFLLNRNPDSNITLFDTDLSRLDKVICFLKEKYGNRVSKALNPRAAIMASPIIVSTATSDVLSEEPEQNLKEILQGKVFIDDAQPFSIRPWVEEGGAKIIWVVGKGPQGGQYRNFRRNPVFTYPTRGGLAVPWNYGSPVPLDDPIANQGLVGPSDEFGCGLEALALALCFDSLIGEGLSREEALEYVREQAVQDAVDLSAVERIEELYKKIGMNPDPTAITFQAFGFPVDVEKGSVLFHLRFGHEFGHR